MIPPYSPDGQKILGFPMNQNRYAVPTWSYIMELHPPARIIEIGAYNGGFTLCLALHAYHINCHVYSWDVCEAPSEEFRELAKVLRVKFYRADVFSAEEFMAALIQQPGVTYLLCDGGNKPREFNTFAQYLKPGDLIAAHDYWTDTQFWNCQEIKTKDVEETVYRNRLTPFWQEHFDLAAWLVFQKRTSG